MADSLRLRVLTPQREILDETVDAVTAEGALGQFGVLPLHITFLSSLEPGVLGWVRGGRTGEAVAVKGGYAEVRDDEVTILADEAIPVGQIDRAAAASWIAAAERALTEAPFGHPGHETARRELRWAELCAALAAH